MSAGPVVRIAMWSGPRNISTAMMRSFGARADCAVTDEPFYSAYLVATGLIHPMREEVIASQPTDWRKVAEALVGPPPDGKPIWYQKHMTHHMPPDFGREWCDGFIKAFLIRAPEAVLASYSVKRDNFTLEEIGLPTQAELFDRAADRLGRAPRWSRARTCSPSRAGRCRRSAPPAAFRSTPRCCPGRPVGAPPTAYGRPSGTRRSNGRRSSPRRAARSRSTSCLTS